MFSGSSNQRVGLTHSCNKHAASQETYLDARLSSTRVSVRTVVWIHSSNLRVEVLEYCLDTSGHQAGAGEPVSVFRPFSFSR